MLIYTATYSNCFLQQNSMVLRQSSSLSILTLGMGVSYRLQSLLSVAYFLPKLQHNSLVFISNPKINEVE